MTMQDNHDANQAPGAPEEKIRDWANLDAIPPAPQAADWLFLQPELLDEMHDSVIVMDLDGTMTACNRVARELYGYLPEEMIGQNIAMLYPEEDRTTLLVEALEAVREGRGFRGEVRRCNRSGDYIYTHLSLVLLRDAERKPAAIAGFSVDITSRKLGDFALRHGDNMQRQSERVEAESAQLRRMQQDLRQSNDRLASVLNCMTEGLVFQDHNWFCTYVNPEAARILEREPNDLLGKLMWEPFPKALHSGFFREMKRARDTGQPVHFEEFYPEPLNKWLECHCYPTGEGLAFYFRDVTEKRHYVETVLDSDNRARLGMQVAKLALAEIDYDTNLNHLSLEAARMFGLGDTALAVTRAQVHATFHPEDRDEINLRMRQSFDPDGPGWFSMDHRVVWPGGEVRWLRVRKQVYFTEGSSTRRPLRAMLAAFDVTVEKSALELARQGEHRFRTLAESLPQLIWEADSTGAKLYCNHNYLDYVGQDSVQGIEDHWLELIHPDDRERASQRWTEALRTGKPYMAEYRLQRADGEYRHFVAHAVPTYDRVGKNVRWLGASTDIHEQKLAEEALRRSEMVAAAGKLAASVAHEINNPLSSVINLLYILQQDGKLDGANGEYLTMAQDELSRISEMTTQALRFHKQSTDSSAIRIDQIVDAILKLKRRALTARKLSILREYHFTDPFHCRADDVRQAIANVIENAIDASPEGASIRIRVRRGARWRHQPKPGVRITIADQGPGIARDNLGRIFQAFFSTKGITSTGLGLWITNDLIARCGGTVSVRSTTQGNTQGIRTGSTFSLFLPTP